MKKTERPPLIYLPLDTVKGLLDQLDRKTVRGRRDAVLLSLLYDTGGDIADISDEITPHWLRHSKAMHLLQAGVNLVYIRTFLDMQIFQQLRSMSAPMKG